MMKIRLAHSPDSDDAFMFYGLASGKVPSLCSCWADAFEPNLTREELLEVAEVIKRGAASDQMNPALRKKYEGLVPYVKARCTGTQ